MKGTKRFILLLAGAALLISGCEKKEKAPEALKEAFFSEDGTCRIEGTEVFVRADKAEASEEVRPSNPSGYFYYYEDQEGYHYHVIYTSLLNSSHTLLKAADFAAAAWGEAGEYEAKVVLQNSAGSTFMDGDAETAGEEAVLYIISMVKDTDPDPDWVTLYYNEGLRDKAEGEPWDYSLEVFSDTSG